VVVSTPVVCAPFRPLPPFQAPVAKQAVAFADDQDNAELAPLAIVVGDAANMIDGAGGMTVTVAD
jgi:hypothetical protein